MRGERLVERTFGTKVSTGTNKQKKKTAGTESHFAIKALFFVNLRGVGMIALLHSARMSPGFWQDAIVCGRWQRPPCVVVCYIEIDHLRNARDLIQSERHHRE